MAGFGGLADHHETLAIELFGHLLGLALELEIARLEMRLHRLEFGAVVLGRAQRRLRQQEIAGEPVLDADDLTHLAELCDPFEQNDFHDTFSCIVVVGEMIVFSAAARPAARVRPPWRAI
jgi:hypothetical protein